MATVLFYFSQHRRQKRGFSTAHVTYHSHQWTPLHFDIDPAEMNHCQIIIFICLGMVDLLRSFSRYFNLQQVINIFKGTYLLRHGVLSLDQLKVPLSITTPSISNKRRKWRGELFIVYALMAFQTAMHFSTLEYKIFFHALYSTVAMNINFKKDRDSITMS